MSGLPRGRVMLSAKDLYNALLAAYGRPRWWSDDPFTVMFQAVLVQNTNWNSVEKTCGAIADRLSSEYIEGLREEELERLIRPCGFYKAKARTIKALAEWFRQYCFDRQTVQKKTAAELRAQLLSIRGVGAETADVILTYAFYKPAFIIDAYTRRLLLRLGHNFSDDTAVRCFFNAGLPEDAELYGRYHWLILEHCISVCKKTPKCDTCPIKTDCAQNY